jgi:hypothetical protein
MSRFPRRLALPVVLAAAVAVLVACVPAETVPSDCEAPAVTRQATLGEALDPAVIEVCKGQEVTISYTIERDVFLHMHGYDDEVAAREVHAGEVADFQLTAVRSGQFPIVIHTPDGPAETTVGTFIVHEP